MRTPNPGDDKLGKIGALITLGAIVIFCLLFWLLQPERGFSALVIAVLIIIGLFLYLFLGNDSPSG